MNDFSQNASAYLITFKKLHMGGVPPAWFPWQQNDHTHSRQQPFVNKKNVFHRRRSDFYKKQF